MEGRLDAATATAGEAAVDLYWLPLGAGGWFVRLNGRVYEAVAAGVARRPRRALYHSALEVRVPEGRFAIEMTPVRSGDGADRGVVASGSVGAAPPAASGSSATRSAAGATASSRTSSRRSRARGG